MSYFTDESEDLQRIRSNILKNRSTSLMNDRERAKFMGLPEGCRMRENAKILEFEKFKCGINVWIGEGAILDAQGGLEIGDFSQIGLYVMIWSHSSSYQALTSQTGIDKSKIVYVPTKIGKNCFIAGHSVIGAGVTLGNRVIVLPNSYVDKDLPDNAIFGTNLEIRNLYKKIEILENEIIKLKNQ